MTTISKLPTSTPLSGPQPDPALRQAAQGFEAILLRKVIGSMRNARLGDDIFGSKATDQFRQMADAHTADEIAKLGAFGISQMLERQFASKGAKS